MKLFKLEVKFKHRRRGRTGAEAIVHARTAKAARDYLAGKFTGCEIVSAIELPSVPKHFIVADLVD